MDTPIATNSLVLGPLLARNARYRPRHPAVVVAGAAPGEPEIRLDWREFDTYVNRFANALAGLGVGRGERVATVLGNSLELLATYWACAKLGAAAVPLSPLLAAPGLASLLADARPRVLIGDADTATLLDEARASAPAARESVFVSVDSGGTGRLGATGRPGESSADRAGRAPDVTAPTGAFNLGTLLAEAGSGAPAATVAADDLLTLMYTSGTTGLPKGIQHTHFIRAMYATLCANAWRMAPESVVLHAGSLVFNGAMTTMFPAFMLGATYVLQRSFTPDAFIAAVERERVTHVMLVPAQLVAILDAPGFDARRLASLQMILSLGAPLHGEQKDRLERVLPGRLYELYGLTEGFITILDRDEARRKSGSVGVPPPFFEMRIVGDDGRELAPGEIGEIAGRGPITMPGYYGRPDLTGQALRDGWLYSGDLGYVDDEGFLYLVDRKKDMIDSGGIKVYPRDIEEVAARHPAVREVAVFGVPHDRWGETPVAAVVLRTDGAIGADELRDWINARVAAKYQRLDRVMIYPDFPRSAAGKTLKRELRAPFWAGRGYQI